MSEEPAETIQIWQQDDGLWRWRWAALQDGKAADSLISFMAFDSRTEARESARESYPHLRVDGDPPAAEESSAGHPGKVVRVAAVLAVAALVLAFRRRVTPRHLGTGG